MLARRLTLVCVALVAGSAIVTWVAGRAVREVAGVEAEPIAVVLAAFILSALAGAVMAALIARQISRPITRQTAAVRAAARGDLALSSAAHGRDEIGDLGRTFDEMAARHRETIDALSTDSGHLRSVLAAMDDGLVLVDRDERVILMNRAGSELLAASGDGGRLIELVHDHELHQMVQESLRHSQPRAHTIRLGPTGRELRITVTPMQSGGAAALILVQDVSDLRRAETIRREFAANVSHELKTPLAALKALVETLEDGALDDPPAAREFLARMHVEVDGLAQLVQELLDLARIESGRTPMVFEERDVADILESASNRLRAQADRARISLLVLPDGDLPAVRADAARVESALINLLHNAIKFTGAGGRVVVRAERWGHDVRVLVEDTGVGIAADDVPRLFERFYKADKSRASTGTGLGLAIVKHIVQAHGGQVGATSELGKGSTFWFTLNQMERAVGVPRAQLLERARPGSARGMP